MADPKIANSTPGYFPGMELDAVQMAADIGAKVDGDTGFATNLTINGGALQAVDVSSATVLIGDTAVPLLDFLTGKSDTSLSAYMDAIMTGWITTKSTDETVAGWWSNNGTPTYTGVPVGPGESDATLTVRAALQSYQQLMASLPTDDPGDGVSEWNNNGVLAQSVKA